MKIIGVDPGGTTGICHFEDDKLVGVEEVKFDDFNKWLQGQTPDLFVVENYRIRPPNQTGGKFVHAWDKGEALQIIGAIKFFCSLHDIEIVPQEPTMKPQGYKLMGMTYVKGKKGMHMYDAVAHVRVYLAKESNRANFGSKAS